jgi:hypothetical protein
MLTETPVYLFDFIVPSVSVKTWIFIIFLSLGFSYSASSVSFNTSFYKQHFNGLKLNIGAKEKNEYIMEYKLCMNNNGMSDTGSGEPLVQPLAIRITN